MPVSVGGSLGPLTAQPERVEGESVRTEGNYSCSTLYL